MLKDNHERTDSIDSVISFQFSVIGFQDRLVRLGIWNRWGCARMLYLSHKGAPMVSQSLLAQEYLKHGITGITGIGGIGGSFGNA